MTGLIYLVIIALWAAVLIPMWLRRHDTGTEYRSAHRFNRAMHTLRRQRSTYAGYREPNATLQPKRDRGAKVLVPRARPVQQAQSAARRRLVVLTSLAGLATLTLLLAVVGVVPLWLTLIPVMLLAGFVAMVRRAVAAQHRRGVSRRSTERLSRRSKASSRRRSPSYESFDISSLSSDPEVEDQVETVDRSWHAVPTTLPRYVTAPRATGIPRIIDLTHSEEWTSPAILREATTQRDRERAELQSRVVEFESRSVEFFDQYADNSADRRAVND